MVAFVFVVVHFRQRVLVIGGLQRTTVLYPMEQPLRLHPHYIV